TPSLITALRAGEIDIGDVNSEDVIRLTASKDLEMRTINSASGRNFFMIVGKDSLGSILELQGKSFAIARVGSQDHTLSAKVMAEKPEALRRFTAALIKTSRYLAQNKPGWVDAMAKLRPDITRGDLEYLWDQFGSSWAVNGQLNLTTYQASTDFLYETGTFN